MYHALRSVDATEELVLEVVRRQEPLTPEQTRDLLDGALELVAFAEGWQAKRGPEHRRQLSDCLKQAREAVTAARIEAAIAHGKDRGRDEEVGA